MKNLIFKLVRAYMRRFKMLPGDTIETRKFPNGYHGEINEEWLREAKLRTMGGGVK